MLAILQHLNYVPVIVISIIGFVFGALWFSPLLFSKAWMEEVKITKEQHKAQGGGPKKLFITFLCTLAATIALDILIGEHGATTVLSGAKFGLFVGVGIVAALQGPCALFDGRSCRYCRIVIGYNIVLCTLLGAILGVWR